MGPLGDENEHDVHDANAAHGQSNQGERQQECGQSDRDMARDLENRTQVFHMILCSSPVSLRRPSVGWLLPVVFAD